MNGERDIAIPPECGPTLERIQSVLDRIHPASILAADPHPATCAACRERVAAAKLMLALEPVRVAPRPGFADAILANVAADRRARQRRRVFALVGSFAAAAAVVFAVWFNQPKQQQVAKQDPPPPVQETPKLPPAPPIRVNDELAKAGEALRESTRTITEPAANAPRIVASLAEPLWKAPAAPIAVDLGPATKTLADIPQAAKTGLEPVAGTAQKAFNRLLRDVSAIQPKTKS
jgi:hypothetical protein